MNFTTAPAILLTVLAIALTPKACLATPTNPTSDCHTDPSNTVCNVTVSVVAGSQPCTFTVNPDELKVYGQGAGTGAGVTIRWTLDAASWAAGWRFDPWPPVAGLPFPDFNFAYINPATGAAEQIDYNRGKKPPFPYRIKLMFGTVWTPWIETCIKDPTIANQG